MFAAPPRIGTEVFATVPASLRLDNRRADWLALQKRGASMGSFLEGPSFDADGNLYVTDIPFGRIFRISPRGDFAVVAEYDGEPNGLKFAADGTAYIADHKQGLLKLDVRTGAVTVAVDRPRLERFKGLNDLFFAPGGDCYITDQGQTGLQDATGRVYRWRPGGELTCLLADIPSPNGLVLDAAGTSVLLAVTRANAVWRVPLLLDGTTSKVGVFIQMSGGFGPDGMALDADGNLAVCHPGLGAVWLFSPAGEPILRVDSASGPVVTNCAYGGPGNSYLYITEADTGTVLRAKMPHPGRPMAYPSPNNRS